MKTLNSENFSKIKCDFIDFCIDNHVSDNFIERCYDTMTYLEFEQEIFNDMNILTSKVKFNFLFSDISKLKGYSLVCLLIHQPSLADFYDIDWSLFHCNDWCYLLSEQPQFEKYCDFTNFNDKTWDYLIQRQPQFKRYKDGLILTNNIILKNLGLVK